jgi:RimJ/RimL family protein N-acetyltransferase
VSATWASIGQGPIAYLHCDLAWESKAIFLFDTYTLPELRGQGLSPAVADGMVRFFRSRGHTRLIACVLPENRSSLRAREKMGFRPTAVVGYVGAGSRRRYFHRPLSGTEKRR